MGLFFVDILSGDLLLVICVSNFGAVLRVALFFSAGVKSDYLSPSPSPIAETDMVTFAFGIAIGVVIGLFSVNLGQLSIGLGSAGGLLTSGLVIGYLRSVILFF